MRRSGAIVRRHSINASLDVSNAGADGAGFSIKRNGKRVRFQRRDGRVRRSRQAGRGPDQVSASAAEPARSRNDDYDEALSRQTGKEKNDSAMAHDHDDY